MRNLRVLQRGALVAFLVLALVPILSAGDAAENGRILCAYWRELPGANVADLLACPTFPGTPTEQIYLDKLETAADQENNFGTQIRGFIHPPADGAYVFSISSDEQSELWLSPTDNPAGKVKIAGVPTWTLPDKYDQFPEQQSKPVALKAGQKYYLEVLHKDGGGDNHLAVAWKLPDGKMETPIPGSRLSPASPVVIPPPQVRFEPEVLPTAPGRYKLKAQVEYMAQRLVVPVLLTIPIASTPPAPQAVLVYLPDTEAPADGEGFRIQGPDLEWDKKASFRKWSRFIGISIQCPVNQTWTQRIVIQASNAVLEALLKRLPANRQRIYMSGLAAGGTAVWRMAMEKPELYTALAPICGMKVDDKEIAEKLKTMPVFIVTGVKNGFATGCANEMKDLLAGSNPKPEIYYEMEMGNEAGEKAFDSPWFYGWLLNQRKGGPLPGAATAPTIPKSGHFVEISLILSFVLLLCALFLFHTSSTSPDAAFDDEEDDDDEDDEDDAEDEQDELEEGQDEERPVAEELPEVEELPEAEELPESEGPVLIR